MIPISDFLYEVSQYSYPMIKTNKKEEFYNIPAAFDIEVSSFYVNEEKQASMYIWMFGLYDMVTYGRTWQEYEAFIRVLSTILDLNEHKRLVVYVHNLSYEFQFMRKHFKWDKVFFLDERKPVYAISNGIEYRCSWKLSSKSLAKVGEDLQKYKEAKKLGDLDYSLIRTSETTLTEKELGYCEADIRVLLAYIMEKIETDGNISLIPLTNTGYVRNYCRKECFKKYKDYRNMISELTLDSEEYSQLKRGFAGGFTHASAKYVDEILENVGSYDFTSSYPAVMLAEKFPMSKSRLIKQIGSPEKFQELLQQYCCLIDATFWDIHPKVDFDHPISESKCSRLDGELTDNGRIVTADMLTTTMTEQDFMVYSQFYSWSKMQIHTFRIYEKSYLPRSFYKSILELYKRKTVLKNVKGEEVNYMISKNMLNSAYGMTVTDIVREQFEYVDDSIVATKPDLQEAIDKYNNGKKRFLFYPWGVWVTAYARKNLFTGILACGKDYVYSDTDSIKILNPEKHKGYINWYNNNIRLKLEQAAFFHGIKIEEYSPLNQKGIAKPIGIWEYEGMYDKFKTLGAKRYMIQSGDKIKATVAGMHKGKGSEYIASLDNPFKDFKIGLEIPEEFSGRLDHTYNDEGCKGSIVDYTGVRGDYEELSFIHMEPTTYKFDISIEFANFLHFIRGEKEIIDR